MIFLSTVTEPHSNATVLVWIIPRSELNDIGTSNRFSSVTKLSFDTEILFGYSVGDCLEFWLLFLWTPLEQPFCHLYFRITHVVSLNSRLIKQRQNPNNSNKIISMCWLRVVVVAMMVWIGRKSEWKSSQRHYNDSAIKKLCKKY